MTKFKQRQYPKMLPATPCSENIYEQVRSLAKDQGLSLADVMRKALSLFFEKPDTEVSHSNKSISG